MVPVVLCKECIAGKLLGPSSWSRSSFLERQNQDSIWSVHHQESWQENRDSDQESDLLNDLYNLNSGLLYN